VPLRHGGGLPAAHRFAIEVGCAVLATFSEAPLAFRHGVACSASDREASEAGERLRFTA